MIARVLTADGTFDVDLDEEEEIVAADPVEPAELAQAPREAPPFAAVAVAATGSLVVAVVNRRPPLMISRDAGLTWSEAGGGLPPGRDVAIAESNPDVVVYGARNRVYVSENGGVFWRALSVELPEIRAVGAVI